MGLESHLFSKVIIKRDTRMIASLNDCNSYSPQLWFLTDRAKELPVEGEKATAHCPWKGIPVGDCKNKVRIVGIQASFLKPSRRVSSAWRKGAQTFGNWPSFLQPFRGFLSLHEELHFISPAQGRGFSPLLMQKGSPELGWGNESWIAKIPILFLQPSKVFLPTPPCSPLHAWRSGENLWQY